MMDSQRKIGRPYAKHLFDTKDLLKRVVSKTGLIEYQPEYQNEEFQFQPVHQIDSDVAQYGLWHSVGNDPEFELIPVGNTTYSGWYMIEMVVAGPMTWAGATLSFGFDSADSGEKYINLLYNSGKISKRVCFFKKQPAYIRFKPLSQPGGFRVLHLKFVKIPQWFAVSRMIKKIRVNHQAYCGKSVEEIKHSIKGKAAKSGIDFRNHLYEIYSQLFDGNAPSSSYEQWIEKYETPIFSDKHAIQSSMSAFTLKPLISIIMPVYNTEEVYLRKSIQSVLEQSYPNWELCIADDASTNPEISNVLEEFSQRDRRIKVVFRSTNGHISAASNSAFKLAHGEYVALLDHDDELAEHALYFAVKAINEIPDLDILYTDEDIIDELGCRSNPHFKSDWNPYLLYSHNYITHLCIYRYGLIKDAGGFREGLDGAQDYDLVLRCSALTIPEKIRHIPMILYHWRAIPGSSAASPNEKKYTIEAGSKALRYFMARQGFQAVVEPEERDNYYRVSFPFQSKPLVSLIIPTRDNVDVLSTCVESILSKTSYPNYEIVIINNQSKKMATLSWFKSIAKKDNVRVIDYDHPFNYSAINNFGCRNTNGAILGLMNSDTEVINDGWMEELVALARRPEIGCVGAKLLYPDDTIQHAGVILGLGGYAAHSHRGFPANSPGYFNRLMVRQNLSAVTGACLFVKREIYNFVGGMEENLAVAYNDVDFCLKVLETGYLNVFTPYARLYHHESKSRGNDTTPERVDRFLKEKAYMASKWRKYINHDPYYNPNLTRDREDFSLA